VTSTLAADGVDAVKGEHLLVADDAASCAQAILKMMQNRSERQRLSEAARARVISHHHWPNSMQRLDVILGQAMTRNQERQRSMADIRGLVKNSPALKRDQEKRASLRGSSL
jgi:polysaccharide biosynthesis protein PslH